MGDGPRPSLDLVCAAKKKIPSPRTFSNLRLRLGRKSVLKTSNLGGHHAETNGRMVRDSGCHAWRRGCIQSACSAEYCSCGSAQPRHVAHHGRGASLTFASRAVLPEVWAWCPLTVLLPTQQPVIGRRAALLNFAVAGGSLLMPPSTAHADDLPPELAENKLIQILQDAKSLGS